MVIGRGAFHAANEYACGIAVCIQDVLCGVLDNILDVVKGIYSHHVTVHVTAFRYEKIASFCYLSCFVPSGTTDVSFMDPVVIGRSVFSTANDTISGIAGNIQEMLCAVVDMILEVIKGIHFNVLPLNHFFFSSYRSLTLITKSTLWLIADS